MKTKDNEFLQPVSASLATVGDKILIDGIRTHVTKVKLDTLKKKIEFLKFQQ